MATNIRGTQPLAWGTETITGYVVDQSTRDVSTQEFVIVDEEGNEITQITGFGCKIEYSFEVIPKSAVSAPTRGAILTVGTELMVILSINKKRAKRDVEKWSIKAVAYDGIDLS